jgi:hypothetical protein
LTNNENKHPFPVASRARTPKNTKINKIKINRYRKKNLGSRGAAVPRHVE